MPEYKICEEIGHNWWVAQGHIWDDEAKSFKYHESETCLICGQVKAVKKLSPPGGTET